MDRTQAAIMQNTPKGSAFMVCFGFHMHISSGAVYTLFSQI